MSIHSGLIRNVIRRLCVEQTSRLRYFLAALLGLIALVSNAALAQIAGDTLSPENLKKLSMEELMNIEVISVSKQPEKLSETASAIQVITNEDIHRSSATRLPEALRLASNLQVAQVNAHGWAITARGFNGTLLTSNSLADKLLVMIDGRTIYTPLFAGVFWDVQNVFLEDIDRIEVISGPGGTLWGANAVNGVINILSKGARETKGLYVTGTLGSFLKDQFGARYGGKVGQNLYYRVYAQRMDHGHAVLSDSVNAKDDWRMTQGGFRMDCEPSEKNTITFQGDFYGGSENGPDSSRLDGQNLLARWTHTFTGTSNFKLQIYFDRTWREQPATRSSEQLSTYDIDFQHSFMLGDRNHLLWGAGYRFMQDRVNSAPTLVFDPASLDFDYINTFVQDEINVIPDNLKIIAGVKLSDNYFSGTGLQPSGRMAWTPNRHNTLWAAVSHALRSASRFDADVVAPISGKRNFNWEKMTAYELGYRMIPSEDFNISVASFYNDYSDLRSIDQNNAALAFENHQKAKSWGVELAANLQVNKWWKLRGGYTYLDKEIDKTSDAVIEGSDSFEGLDPNHQATIQSRMDLPDNFFVDIAARYIGNLPPSSLLDMVVFSPKVPSYFTFDTRVAWEKHNFELSIVGRNLAEDFHQEFGYVSVPRSVYGKISWRL